MTYNARVKRSIANTIRPRRNGRIGSKLGVSLDILVVEYEKKRTIDKSIAGRDLWNAFTNQYAAWESDAKDIKRQKDSWTTKKRYLEDRLSADEHIVKVRKWIRKANDPEPQIDTIMRRVMPDEKYEDAAQWFLDLPQFDSWCDTFLSSECPPAAKRVLWLRGTYGTGKTTLLYHTYIALKDNPEFHIGSRKVRIVPYFCEAKGTTRPDYETIIRALIRHLSLLPDFSLAKVARDWYSKATSTRGQGDDPDVGEWEDFFEELVQGAVREYKFVFIVDALDECLDLREAELFLDFMSKRIMRSYPNVYMLCSSHQQVRVSDYFYEERRHDVEVTPTATAHEMEKFITGERERRKSTSGDSIFCKWNPVIHFSCKDKLSLSPPKTTHSILIYLTIFKTYCLVMHVECFAGSKSGWIYVFLLLMT